MYDLQIPTPSELSKIDFKFADKTAAELRAEYAELIDLGLLRNYYNNSNKEALGKWQVRMWESKESQKFITDFCFWFCNKYAQKFEEIKHFLRAQEVVFTNLQFSPKDLECTFLYFFSENQVKKIELSLDKDIDRVSYFYFVFTPSYPFGCKEEKENTGKTIEFFTSFFTPKKSEL